jgi:hypothetical protein
MAGVSVAVGAGLAGATASKRPDLGFTPGAARGARIVGGFFFFFLCSAGDGAPADPETDLKPRP